MYDGTRDGEDMANQWVLANRLPYPKMRRPQNWPILFDKGTCHCRCRGAPCLCGNTYTVKKHMLPYFRIKAKEYFDIWIKTIDAALE